MKIGDTLYGISVFDGAWNSRVPFKGRVISFDDDLVVLWGATPNHNDDIDDYDGDVGIMFVQKKSLFDNEKSMRQALKTK